MTASFDAALIDAGIADYNWVSVSSILPPNAKYDEEKNLPRKGSILFCVMSRITVEAGNYASAGIGIARTTHNNGSMGVGFVMEEQTINHKKDIVYDRIKKALGFMASIRGLNNKQLEIITVDIRPQKSFGTAIALVVFNNYEIQ